MLAETPWSLWPPHCLPLHLLQAGYLPCMWGSSTAETILEKSHPLGWHYFHSLQLEILLHPRSWLTFFTPWTFPIFLHLFLLEDGDSGYSSKKLLGRDFALSHLTSHDHSSHKEPSALAVLESTSALMIPPSLVSPADFISISMFRAKVINKNI